jgi:hypothetical protein
MASDAGQPRRYEATKRRSNAIRAHMNIATNGRSMR